MKRTSFLVLGLGLIGLTALQSGCSEPAEESVSTANSAYLASVEPTEALPVGAARESVTDSQSIKMVGVIGGSHNPFVDGLAAFTVVDPKVPHCSADEGCPTPWDYCCTQDQVETNIATVTIVDEEGNPVSADAKKLLNVKELSTVVVEGTASKDADGNLTVSANKVFVRPDGESGAGESHGDHDHDHDHKHDDHDHEDESGEEQ